MKNILYKLKFALLAIGIVGLGSCDAILDQDETDYGKGPVVVQFAKSSITANFIQTDENPVYTYDIPVVIIGGKNEPLNRDVEITISADPSSTATEGVEYKFSGDKTLTLPAGETSVNLKIDVLSENLDAFDPKNLVLQIDSTSEVVSDNNKTDIVLQAACELDMDSFIGTYSAVEGSKTYEVQVTAGPVANTLEITGLLSNSATKTFIELNADPTTPTIIYRSEEFGGVLSVHSVYGDVWATTIEEEASSYVSCSNFMFLEFKRCVSIGCFAGSIKIALTKK